MSKKSLNESTVALILLGESLVLGLETGSFLNFDGNFAFELANVFW